MLTSSSRTKSKTRRWRAAGRVTLTVALAGTLAAAGPLPAGARSTTAATTATTTDTTPPQIHGVRFSRAAVSVSGLAVVPVTVSVHLTDASGIEEIAGATPQLILGPVPGPWSRQAPALTRTSGTATDGIWSATVHVASTWNGAVRVTWASAMDRAGNVLYQKFTAATSPVLRVTGTHRPALTFTYSLLPGGGFRIHGRAYFTDTRRPLRRLPLATAYDANCDLDGMPVNDISTNARGYYEKRWPNGDVAAAGCVALIRPTAPGQRPAVLAYHVASAPRPTIPDAAMLHPEDLNGAPPQPADDDYWSALRPPRPCVHGRLPSATRLRAQRAIQVLIGYHDRPTVVMEHVATYRSNGAQLYLRELRRALATCHRPDEHGGRWRVVATGVAGGDSLLLVYRRYIDYAQTYHDTYVMVARRGGVLVVLADAGWETSSGHEALVRELGAAAVRRVAVLT